ncbi:MAG: hypothetical protein JXN61_15475 [Sedimentisphaerales bacterium]|nr:hypothetical protein [Sedimentisphaerales bacterium]
MPADPNMPLWARIFRRVVRLFVALGVAAILLWVGFVFGGKVLCGIAISQIGKLTNTRIQTGSVDFHTNGCVVINDLLIEPDDNELADRTILKAKKVRAEYDLASLLTLRPQLRRIDVNDFVFSARYDSDARRWNLSALKLYVPKGSSEKMPLVMLGRGILQYSRISGLETKIVASVPLSAKLGFDSQTRKGYSFDFQTGTQAGGSGESHLTGSWRPGHLEVAGGIASADKSAFEMEWMIGSMAAVLEYDQNDVFTLDMRIFDLHSDRTIELDKVAQMGPAFLEASTPFAAVRKFFSRYSPIGNIDLSVKASGNLMQLDKSTLAGSVNCKGVAFCQDEFPYTVEQLKGKIDFAGNSVTLNKLSGVHNDVKLTIDGWTHGFSPNWEYDFHITSDNMKLDDDLYEALSPAQKKTWSLFSPSGAASIDYRLRRSSPQSRTRQLTVDLAGVDALYSSFPYPLKDLRGRIFFDQDDVIISDIVSQTDGQEIVLDGKVTGQGTEELGYDISINASNIPLDQTLRGALSPRQRDLYDQFKPAGLTDGIIKFSKSPQGEVPATFTADISFKQGSLNSARFPLPITDVTATAIFEPDLIDIRKFAGRYGDTPVSLKGQIWPGYEEQPSRYSLALEFKDTILNDDLFKLLPESAAKIVADFRPEGRIDLTAEMKKLEPNDSADYKFVIDCLGNHIEIPAFSYPLKNITGTLTITPNSVEFRDVNAVPGDAVLVKLNTAFIKLDGSVSLENNSFKDAQFKIRTNDIFFDSRLGLALPVGLRRLYNKLVPPAHFDLDFDEVRITPAPDGRKNIDIKGRARLKECDLRIYGAAAEFDADLELDRLKITPTADGERCIDIKTTASLKNCSLPISGAKAQLDAILNMEGLYRTNQAFENCRLLLDGQSFRILGKTFQNLKTGIDYNPERQTWTSRSLTADCYGGKLTGKLEIGKAADAAFAYTLQTSFQNVDLKKFLSDTRMGSERENDPTAGRMEGSLNIGARLGENASRLGTCKLSIVDMQVGRLSPLAKLLQVLRFSEPTKYAFDRMLLDSYIKADELIVKKLDLAGKSAAFYGSGLMDLRTLKIDLGLIARGKRLAGSEPSFIGSLGEGLGRAVVKIEVIGDFYDPQVITTPLPFIKDALEIFGKPIEQK